MSKLTSPKLLSKAHSGLRPFLLLLLGDTKSRKTIEQQKFIYRLALLVPGESTNAFSFFLYLAILLLPCFRLIIWLFLTYINSTFYYYSLIHSDQRLKLEHLSVFLQWPIYLIDLVVDNPLSCFTFPPTQHTASFETGSRMF